MSYVTEQQFEDKIDLPLNLPKTRLRVGEWLIATSINFPASNPYSMKLRWLQLRIIEGQGTVDLGLFKNFDVLNSPDSQGVNRLENIQASGLAPQNAQRDPNAPLIVSTTNQGSGLYSWVASVTVGSVLEIPVTSGGRGYTGAPIVQVSGGGGSGCTAVAHLTGDAVTSITITDPGSGYTSPPTVTLIPPIDLEGSGATAEAITGLEVELNGAVRLDLNPT